MTLRAPDLGDPDGADEVRVDLPPDLTAPRAARAEVREALGRWHLLALVDTVTLAVSELVGNAVVHGRPPVRLLLSRGERQLRASVHDRSPGQPAQAGAPDDAESGRGLAIIDALADDSGVEQAPQGGKIVYATFATDAEDPAEPAPESEGAGAPVVRLAPVRELR